jgi:hypothetical protein
MPQKAGMSAKDYAVAQLNGLKDAFLLSCEDHRPS